MGHHDKLRGYYAIYPQLIEPKGHKKTPRLRDFLYDKNTLKSFILSPSAT